ncbi:hypothetical protein QFZ76_010122 [Streptomyces sp. V4I2]|nr:hypothetical protein [Streptomyces sp. V4I2]
MVDVPAAHPAPASPANALEACHRRSSPGVRPVTVDAGGITLSGLLSEPQQTATRVVIIGP